MTPANEGIASLFLPEPSRGGLRGDPHLWREMAGYFKGVPLPETRSELARALEDAFLALTDQSISYPQHFVMERHAHGGMSSGGISPRFWREHGIPLLLSRFVACRQVRANGATSSMTSA